MDKASPGSPFRVPPASIWNGMIAAGSAYTSAEELGTADARLPRSLSTDCLILKNTSGGALARGRVLEVSTKLATPKPNQLLFTGITPAPDGTKKIAVLKYAAANNEFIECQGSGFVQCRLNVNHVQQQWADVDSGSTLLQSKWHGRCEIVWKETASTGEQDAVVCIGTMFIGPLWGSAPSGITRGSSGTVNVDWGDSPASPTATITAYFDRMDGGPQDVPTGGEVAFVWRADRQKYQLLEGECDH